MMLEPARGHELHPHTDPQKGASFDHDGLVQRVHHARHRIEPTATIEKCPNTGQDNVIGFGNGVRIGRHCNRARIAHITRRPLKGFRRRAQITRAIIDNCNAHQI